MPTAVLPPESLWSRDGRTAGEKRALRCLGVWLVVEGNLVEVGRRAVAVEVDGRLRALVDDERVAVELDECGRELRAHELPHRGAQRAGSAGQRSLSAISTLTRRADLRTARFSTLLRLSTVPVAVAVANTGSPGAEYRERSLC